MDTPQLTHISLCAGYGGIDLGLRRVLPSLRTIAYSEIEEYACGLLAARMEGGHLDPAPIWSDLKTFPFSEFHGCVDILSGGYPCQPFSAAGKRRGTDDPRHLWPFIADGIQLCQPAFCFFENVEGHISLGLQDVLGDLADLGYRATWGLFSASEVGAPHQRKRVFILAHSLRERRQLSHQRQFAAIQELEWNGEARRIIWPSRPGEAQFGWEPPRVVANPNRRGLEGAGAERGRAEDAVGPDRAAGRQAQPALGGDADGPASGLDYADLSIACHNRTDELRLLGNGVVPATAERAFRTLYARIFP